MKTHANDVCEQTDVLITVMTYPHPSRGYYELVCTAGITRDLQWVRLYPIDYRYRPYHQQFRKYQWVSLNLHASGAGNDGRRESRRPDIESMEILGPPLSTENGWLERRAIIDQMPHHTVKQLRGLYEKDKTSLGITRPQKVLDLKVERITGDWKPEWQQLFHQLPLFGKNQKPLKKIPYKFSYVFECEDSHRPHSAMIEDWELGVLWLKEAARLGSEEAAAQSVKEKFLSELCGEGKDTRFFMGTTFPYNSWVVLGVFWPPTSDSTQPSLF